MCLRCASKVAFGGVAESSGDAEEQLPVGDVARVLAIEPGLFLHGIPLRQATVEASTTFGGLETRRPSNSTVDIA
jgi:hypothetical protein